MTIPSESDINVRNSLDEIIARDNFLGKTLDEAEQLFRENSLAYQEDLMWMGPRAFAYYLRAVIDYLRSPHSAGDDDLISCLHMIILFRRDEEDFALALEQVRELVDYVLSDFDKFLEVPEVYGDLPEKYRQLKQQLDSAG